MTELRSRHLFTVHMKLHPALELGDTPAGKRRLFTVAGGEFTGERLHGQVWPQGGSDLLLVRADGSRQQDVRLVLQTGDGALIVMTYRGVFHAPAEVSDRMARGEVVEVLMAEHHRVRGGRRARDGQRHLRRVRDSLTTTRGGANSATFAGAPIGGAGCTPWRHRLQ